MRKLECHLNITIQMWDALQQKLIKLFALHVMKRLICSTCTALLLMFFPTNIVVKWITPKLFFMVFAVSYCHRPCVNDVWVKNNEEKFQRVVMHVSSLWLKSPTHIIIFCSSFSNQREQSQKKSLSTITFLGTLSRCYLSDKFRKYMGWTGKKIRQCFRTG